MLSRVDNTSFLTRDEQEVAGYAEVMETIFDHFSEIPATENYIKQLHSSLLRHSEKDDCHRGGYKKHVNSVEAFAANSHHRITISDAERLINSFSRPTIKNRLSKLVEAGLLVRHGKARGTWYSKPD